MRFLGGSSGCNGTLCIRGVRQDYDDWGLEGWSGSDMFQYMKKVGNYQHKEAREFRALTTLRPRIFTIRIGSRQTVKYMERKVLLLRRPMTLHQSLT